MITVYAIMAGVGGLFFILVFILSEIVEFFEGLLDGLFDSFNIDLDLDGGVGYFLNARSMFAFITFFGATGLIGTAYFKLSPLWSVVFSTGVGVVAAGLIGFVVVQFMKHESTGALTEEHYVGQIARVTLTIPADGLGEVFLSVAGMNKRLSAYSLTGEIITEGSLVVVRQKQGSAVYVQPYQEKDN